MIRNYSHNDFSKCVEIVNKVWDFDSKFKPNQLADLFKKIYVSASLASSNFNIVIEEDGIVKGFLLGKCGNSILYENESSGLWGKLNLLFQLLSLKGVSFKKNLHYLKIIAQHEANRRKIEPDRNNEVNLFAVDPSSQGKGFGKLLMNTFLNHCKKLKVLRVTLDTDKECNYKFYQHFGFTIKGEFFSPLQKEYSFKSGVSYVYELKL
jgi:GNAT superfamily N-acetyltransferase